MNAQENLISAALELLFKQGIKRTTLEQVAHQAGLTRITVYRYYPGKQALVEAALLSIPSALEQLQADLEQAPGMRLQEALARLAAVFARLPGGNAPALLEETQRLYPELWQVFQERRAAAMAGIFQSLFLDPASKVQMRPELNPQVAQAFLLSSVIRVVEDPSLVALGLPADEIFQTVLSIFLHGVLVEPPTGESQ